MPSLITPSSGAAADQLAELVSLNAAIAANAAAALARGDITGTVYDPVSGTHLTVKRAFASLLTAADTSIIAAVTGKKIRVLALRGQNNATASTITFNRKPAGSAVAISAAYVLPVAGVLDFSPNAFGWLETPAAEGLTATAAAGGTVALQVIYVEVPE